MVHRGLAGVEVDRVAHRPLVGEVHVDRVAEVDSDRRARNLAAKGPGVDHEPLGDGDVLVDDRQVDVVDGAGQDLGGRGIEELVRWRGRVCDGRRRRAARGRCGRRRRSRPSDHDFTLHARVRVAGDRAQEGDPLRRDRHRPGRPFTARGGDLRPVTEGDVMEGGARIVELDLVCAGRGDRDHGGLEAEVERLDRDLLGLCRGRLGCRCNGLCSSAGGRGGLRPATRPGPSRTPTCGQREGETGEYCKAGDIAAHLGSPDPITAIGLNTYRDDMSLPWHGTLSRVPNGPISDRRFTIAQRVMTGAAA